jgi:hypothetical protein
MHSGRWSLSGFMVAIMLVLQLPPRLSRSTLVIRLLRYGTNDFFPRARSCSAMMTISRKCKLLLMNLASFSVRSVA